MTLRASSSSLAEALSVSSSLASAAFSRRTRSCSARGFCEVDAASADAATKLPESNRAIAIPAARRRRDGVRSGIGTRVSARSGTRHAQGRIGTAEH